MTTIMNKYEMYCTCGELRFYVKEKVYLDDMASAPNIIQVDGSEPKEGTVIPNCPGCGKHYYDTDPDSEGVKGGKYG